MFLKICTHCLLRKFNQNANSQMRDMIIFFELSLLIATKLMFYNVEKPDLKIY